MTTAYAMAAFFALVIVSMLLVARAYQAKGRADALAEVRDEGEGRRDAFDKEVSRPVSRGTDLISRLRRRVDR